MAASFILGAFNVGEKSEKALAHIFRGIGILQTESKTRRFTIDGPLVGGFQKQNRNRDERTIGR
jgi:hypothetical protein